MNDSDVRRQPSGGVSVRLAMIRPLIDVCAAFLFFLILSLTIQSAPSAAGAYQAGKAVPVQTQVTQAIAEDGDRPIIEIATTSAGSPDAVYRRTSSAAAWLLLAMGFSLVVALNMALVRHMRQAYAKPRRKG